ncbi:DUF1353 domain-containing protein [Mangrovimicrobium sediminis]|uniref:N-acetylmuramoyl-L-alanine amidase n=1 Tax=Mangrovimicrobium sediminis TaxID=2562682 RepID=A0A4Z0LY99_9GAMM|nr:N-acetylmuramoyl-L-alanine amidase [Haliea sp. SAOS-164]TGD72194.1 DUF1353 domain-containing protein [Haliea sp. SAOS-164]
MVNIIQDYIPTSLPTRPQTPLTASYITIHNTDNTTSGANAAAHNRYVRSEDAVKRMVSWHYTVDDKGVYQHLPTDEVGFHASRGNTSSIGVEICMNSDMDDAKGYSNAAKLVAFCIKKLGLTFPGCMKQHHDWSGKNCPSVIRAGAVIDWGAFLNLCEKNIAASKLSDTELLSIDQPAVPEWAPDDAEAVLRSIDEAMDLHQHEEGEQCRGTQDDISMTGSGMSNESTNGKTPFSGEPDARWLTERGTDHDMMLLEDFWYRDPDGKIWQAPSGTIVDGASIPKPLWSTVGSPYTGNYRRASIVHDVACVEAGNDWHKRRAADRMFYYACRSGGCSVLQSIVLYIGVRIGALANRVPVWEAALSQGEVPQIRPSAEQERLLLDFQIIAEKVVALGEPDDANVIQDRTDDAMSEVMMINFAMPPN